MEDRFFTVQQAASIVGCKPSWVYQLLADGWLNGPGGGTKKERRGRVTQKSLFQFMVIDRLSRLPVKTLKELKNGRKHFGRFFSIIAEANCLSIDEGSNALETPPLSSLSNENCDRSKRCLHHDFAELHQFSFGWRARQLAPDDPALQDDLVQEMSLAVLEHEKPASFEFLFELAGNRAINYLKYEAARGMLPLSQARHASDSFAEKMASLQELIDQLRRRGVPAEWIEEVIGRRLDVA